MSRFKLRRAPLRVTTGAFILSAGLDKWKGDEQTAARIHGFASGTYPFLKGIEPTTVPRLLAAGEIAVGSALLLPVVPAALAGAALTGFSAGLLGLYVRTPGMRRGRGTCGPPRRACRSPRTSGCSARGSPCGRRAHRRRTDRPAAVLRTGRRAERDLDEVEQAQPSRPGRGACQGPVRGDPPLAQHDRAPPVRRNRRASPAPSTWRTRPAPARRPRTRPSRSGRGAARPARPAPARCGPAPRARAAAPPRSRPRSRGPSAGGTPPRTTPCGSSTSAAAKRHAPMWLDSHVRSGSPRPARRPAAGPAPRSRCRAGRGCTRATSRSSSGTPAAGSASTSTSSRSWAEQPVRTASRPGRESTRNQRRRVSRTGAPRAVRTNSTRPVCARDQRSSTTAAVRSNRGSAST